MFLATKFGSWETWIKWIRIAIYHTIGWGLPFLFIVIPTSAGKMGFEPASTLYSAFPLPLFPFSITIVSIQVAL